MYRITQNIQINFYRALGHLVHYGKFIQAF